MGKTSESRSADNFLAIFLEIQSCLKKITRKQSFGSISILPPIHEEDLVFLVHDEMPRVVDFGAIFKPRAETRVAEGPQSSV